MAYGVQNQIGIGSAQVLPEGPSHMPLVNQLARQKQYKDEQKRYEDQLKKRDEKELYDLIGDNLNLKDFNPVIHDKVKKAQIELANKIKAENPSYADTYIAAQNAAGQLGQLSMGLNKLDQQIALTKKEYEGDKRINSGNIEMIARKKILDQLNEKGTVDPNVNYFDEALNEYPEFALTDKSDYTVTKFIPEEKQPLFGKYKQVNTRGATDEFDWKTDTYPVYYDFKDNGEQAAPTITTRAEPSGLKDNTGNEIPMLSEDAYGRFKATPSNVAALNLRIKKQHGKDIDLRSEEAEKLRRIEAYKDVERQKPRVNASRVEKAAPERSHSFYFGSGFGQGGAESQINNVYLRVKEKLGKRRGQGQEFLPASLLDQDEKDEVLKIARAAKADNDIAQEDLKLIEGNDGSIRIFGKDDNFIAFMGETGTNLPRQADVKGKRAVVEKSNQTSSGGRSYNLNGKSYSQSAVEAAAKKSGMSVESYIKKAGLK